MDPVQLVIAIATGALVGAGYGILGVATKKQADEPIKVRKLVRTAVIFACAGVMVALANGGDVSRAAIANQLPQVSVVGVVVDMMWAKLARAGVVERGATITDAIREQ